MRFGLIAEALVNQARACGLALLTVGCLVLGATSSAAEVISVFQKISQTQGGFTGTLIVRDQFGNAVEPLGDLDGPGPSVMAIAVGARDDSATGFREGAFWILFLDSSGSVLSQQKINEIEGGFTGLLGADLFGNALAFLGDLDGPGGSVAALAVAAPTDDAGSGSNINRGAVWILFLNADGTVASHLKIGAGGGGSTGVGGLPAGSLSDGDKFGTGLAALGDLDGPGPGLITIAVAADSDNDGGSDRGAVWLLHLDSGGTVVGTSKISDSTPGFGGVLQDGDLFGSDIAALGDIDGAGASTVALAVGSRNQLTGGPVTPAGEIFVILLAADLTVSSFQRIAEGQAGFTGDLDGGQNPDRFAFGLDSPGDLDGDGVPDLLAGAYGDDDGGVPIPNFDDRGALWALLLNADGTVKCQMKVSSLVGGLPPGSLKGGLAPGLGDNGDNFGVGLARLGDIDGDGSIEIAVGAMHDNDGGIDLGAVWLLTLEDTYCCGDGTLESCEECDDGNITPGDGCNEICRLERLGCCGDPAQSCFSDAACAGGDTCCLGHCGPIGSCDASGGACSADDDCLAGEECCIVCGSATLDIGEECDDGNTTSGDGCSDMCLCEGLCGNGIVECDEQCDDGATADGDGCSARCLVEGVCTDADTCTPPCDDDADCQPSCGVCERCGNGRTDSGEACDDGNVLEGDGCDTNCTLTACGNGVASTGEECDDGNTADGDGCSAACRKEGLCEDNLTCQPPCDDDADCVPSCGLCVRCGDGRVDTGETCDDGNDVCGDGCDPNCEPSACGNDYICASTGEVCDDGNTDIGDGCSATCTCEGACGDGDPNLVEGCEECDADGANCPLGTCCASGCETDCTAVSRCTGTFDCCVTVADCPAGQGCCGDGVVNGDEGCDDGNAVPGDGCNELCQLECAQPLPRATPVPVSGTGLKCQKTINKETSKFVKAKTKALQKCAEAIIKDKTASDPGPGARVNFCLTDGADAVALKAQQKIDKAASKVGAKIAKVCGGDDRVCGTLDTDEATPDGIGFYGTCPGFEGRGSCIGGDNDRAICTADSDCTGGGTCATCDGPVTDCEGLSTCIACIGEAALDQAIVLYYDSLLDVPAGDLQKCQTTIGKEATKYLAAKEKTLQKCWDAGLKGKHSEPCPSVLTVGSPGLKAAEKIARAESKMISKICRRCGGDDGDCDDAVRVVNQLTPQFPGSGGGDDPLPSAIGAPATCDTVTVPGGPACGIAIDTLGDLVSCVSCVTEFKVDCIDRARVPEFHGRAYPCECSGP